MSSLNKLFNISESGVLIVNDRNDIIYVNDIFRQFFFDKEMMVCAEVKDLIKCNSNLDSPAYRYFEDLAGRYFTLNLLPTSSGLLIYANQNDKKLSSNISTNSSKLLLDEIKQSLNIFNTSFKELMLTQHDSKPKVIVENQLKQFDDFFNRRLLWLNDLVDLYSNGNVAVNERIVLTELWNEVLEELSNTLEQKRICMNGRDSLESCIYGNSLLIKKLLIFCVKTVLVGNVKNIVSVNFVPHDNFVMILFTADNAMSNLNMMSEDVFSTLASTDCDDTSIGSSFAKFIVNEHGGNLKISEINEQFEIALEIPVGAPKETTAVSNEQIEMYARDLNYMLNTRECSRPKLKIDPAV